MSAGFSSFCIFTCAVLLTASHALAQSDQMMRAVKYGDTKLLEALIQADPRSVNSTNRDGEAPLHWAAISGHANVVNLLISKGADVNIRTRDDWTPLHWAAMKGHTRIVEILIDNGADVNATTDGGWTPLHVAAYQDQKNAMRMLLERGANVNARDASGKTPLNVVAEKTQSSMLILVEKGASVQDAETSSTWSPFRWASGKKEDREERAELLKKTKELETKIAQTDQIRNQLRKELEQTRNEREDLEKEARTRVERIRSAKEREIEGLEKTIADMKKDLADARQREKEASAAIRSQKKDHSLIDELEEKLKEESRKRLEAERIMAAERRSFQDNIDNLTAQIDSIQKNLADSRAVNEDLKLQLENRATENEELVNSLKATSEANTRIKDQEIGDLKNKWIEDQSLIAKLQEQLKTVESSKIELLNRIEEESEKRATAEHALDEAVDAHSSQIADLKSRLQKSEDTQLALRKELGIKDARTEEILKEMASDSEEALAEQQKQLVSLQERWAEDQNRITQLETDLKAAKALNDKLSSQLKAEASARLESARTLSSQEMEFKENLAENTRIKEALDNALSKLKTAEANLREKSASASRRQQETEQLRKELAEKTEANAGLRKTIDSWTADTKLRERELQNRIDDLSREKQEAEVKLKDSLTAEKRLRKQLEQQEGELNNLITTLKTRQVQDRTAIAALEKQLTAARTENADLTSKLKKETSMRLDNEAGSAAEIKEMKKELASARNTIEKLNKDLSAAHTGVDKKQSDLNAMAAEKQSLEAALAESKKNASDRQNYVTQLEEALNRAHDEIQKLKSGATAASKEVNSLQQTHRMLEDENQSLKEEIAKLRKDSGTQIKSLAADNTELSSKLKKSNDQLTELQKQLSSTSDKSSSLSTALKKAQSEKADLEKQLADLEKNSSAEIDDLKKDIAASSNESSTLSTALKDARKQVTDLEKRLAGLVDDSSEQIDSLQKQVADRDSTIESLNARLDKAESSGIDIGRQLAEETRNTKELEDKLAEEQKQNQTAQQSLAKLKKEVKTLSARVLAEATEHRESEELAASLGNRLTERDKQIASLEKEVADLSTKLLQATDDKKSLEEASRASASEQQKQIGNLHKTVDDLNLRLEQARTQNESLGDQIQTLSDANSELVKQVAEADNYSSEIASRHKALEKENSKLAADKAKTEADLAKAIDSREKLEADLKALQEASGSQAQDMVARIKDRESRIAGLTGQIEDLKASVAELASANTNLTEKLARREQDLKDLSNDSNASLKRAKDLEAENQVLALRVVNETDARESLQQKYDTLKSSSEGEVNDLNAAVSELAMKSSNIEKQLAQTLDRNKQLLSDNRELRNQLEKSTADARSRNQEALDKAASQLEDANNANTRLKAEITKTLADNKRLADTNAGLQRALDRAKKANEESNQTIEELNEKLEEVHLAEVDFLRNLDAAEKQDWKELAALKDGEIERLRSELAAAREKLAGLSETPPLPRQRETAGKKSAAPAKTGDDTSREKLRAKIRQLEEKLATRDDSTSQFQQEPELETRLQQSNEMLQKMQVQAAEQDHTIANLNKELKSLKSNNAELKKLNDELTNRIAADTQAREQADRDAQTVSMVSVKQVNNLTEKIAALEKKLKDTATAQLALQDKLKAGQTREDGLKRQIAAKEDEAKAREAKFKSELKARDAEYAKLEAKLKAMDKLREELESARNLSQDLSTKVLQEATTRQEVKEEAETRIEALQTQVSNLQTKLNDAELIELNLHEELRQKEEEIATRESEFNAMLVKNNQGHNQDIAKLRADMEKQQSTIDSLHEKLSNAEKLQGEIAKARESNKKLSVEILKEATARVDAQKTHEERVSGLMERITGLEETLSEVENAKLDLRKQLEKRSDEIARLRKSFEEQWQTLESRQGVEKKQMEKALADARTEIQALQGRLDEARTLKTETERLRTANSKLNTEITNEAKAKLEAQRNAEKAQKRFTDIASDLRAKVANLEQRLSETDFAKMQALHELKTQQEENAALKARLVEQLAATGEKVVLPPREQTSTSELTKVKVARAGVSLRVAPDNNSQVVCQVDKDTILAARNIGKDWVEVIPPTHVDLWVHGDFINDDTVNCEQIHVRSGPGIGYDVVGQLVSGDKIHVRGKQEGWIKFSLPRMQSLWVERQMVTPVP